jgi:monomeric isocitrate dehydrogenase
MARVTSGHSVFDQAKLAAIMRPSATFNAALASVKA